MKLKLSALALFASLALGLGFTAPASATAAAGVASAASDMRVDTAESLVEQVNSRHYRESRRDGRRDWRRHDNRREWRLHRDDRWAEDDRKRRDRWNRWDRRNDRWHHRRDHRRYDRHYRHRPNVYLEFGLSSPRYVQPRYVQPRYVQPRQYRTLKTVRLTYAHYEWCQARYRSYRSSDNSFNPGKGKPRRQCISPYS